MNIPDSLKKHHLWLETSGRNGDKFYAVEADLSKADLSGAILRYSNLRKADLRKAILRKADLRKADLWKAILRNANLAGANLTEANLRNANLTEANLTGTNLTGANLTGANLTGANLIGADLRRAFLNGAFLNGAFLNGAILYEANLSNADLSNVNLSNADLSNVNLSNANLSNANLSNADLSNANLSNANLSNANLNRVQALQTNFNSAVLTGACIEDWNINSNTELENIVCQAIYLKYGYGKYTDRRPSNEDAIFADGDFEKLVRKAQDTVDLIFRNGIDWKAFAISIEQFKVESDGVELSIQAIENKGKGDFVIRVNVPADANKSDLEKFLMSEYESARNALEAQYIAQLEAKDKQNQDYRQEIEFYRQQNTNLLEAVKFLSVRPITINVENIAIAESKSASDNTRINQSGANNPNATVAKDNASVQNILRNNQAEQ